MSELNPTSHMLGPCLNLNMLSSLLSLYQLCDAHQCVDIYWLVHLCNFVFLILWPWVLILSWANGWQQVASNRWFNDGVQLGWWPQNTQKAEWWGRSSFGKQQDRDIQEPNTSTVNQFEKCLLLAPLTRCRKLKIGAVWDNFMAQSTQHVKPTWKFLNVFFRVEWNEWSVNILKFPISIVGFLQSVKISTPCNICSTALHHPSWLHLEPWWQWRTWSSSGAKKPNGGCLVRKC